MSLKRRHLVWTAGLFAFSLFGGCTPDLGTPDYSDQVGLIPEPSSRFSPLNPPPVPPDPFRPNPGGPRLSVGYFYESGRSETIPINTVTTNYFVFDTDENEPPGATRSFVEGTSNDRLEGLESYQITLIDCLPPPAFCFWGSGILWDEPIDLSDWTTMFVSFKSSDPSFATFELALASGEGEDPPGVTLDPRDYGYTNDGQWHSLEIPLQDLGPSFNATLTRSPFTIAGPRPQRGDVLLVDNLYFTKDVTGGTGGTGGMGGQAGTGGTGGTGGSGGAGGMGAETVYEQNFNQLDITGEFIGDGWLYFINAFAAIPYGYSGEAPNGRQISALVDDQGGAEQEPQQLSVYSDYENQDHGAGVLIETNVFQEPFGFNNRIPQSEVGSTYTFRFQAKAGNIGGSSTANAFIKTLDPDADFSESESDTVDTTNLPDTWGGFTLSIDITSDLEGHLLQYGFQTNATNFEPSANFYDNVLVTKSGGDGTGGTGGSGGTAGMGGMGGTAGTGGAGGMGGI